MNLRIYIGLMFVIVIVACAPDTLQSTYEQQQKEDGMDGYNIIHIEENDGYGLVLATAWTEQYIENKDSPGIRVYEKADGKWVAIPGTTCDAPGGGAVLGIGGGNYLYCGSFGENRPFVEITVGETAARIFDVNDEKRVWYAVEKSRDMTVRGTNASGKQVSY